MYKRQKETARTIKGATFYALQPCSQTTVSITDYETKAKKQSRYKLSPWSNQNQALELAQSLAGYCWTRPNDSVPVEDSFHPSVLNHSLLHGYPCKTGNNHLIVHPRNQGINHLFVLLFSSKGFMYLLLSLQQINRWVFNISVGNGGTRARNESTQAKSSLDGLGVEVTTLCLGGSKGGGGLPLGRGTGSGLLHHLVDLLERQALGLGNEEVGVDEGSSAETTPDEEDGRLHVSAVLADHVGGDDGNDGVPEPVGGSGETNTTGADGEREDLSDENPGTGAPCRSEEEDEDGDESNLGVDGGNVLGDPIITLPDGVVETDCDTDDGNEELADQHAKSTPEKDGAATEPLNSPERDRGGEDVDDGKDHGNQEAVADGAGGLEEGGRVVEDEVDTGPLLHHLERSTKDGLAEVGVGLEERTLEAVGPRSEPGGGGDELALVLLVGDDLGKFNLDVLRVLGLTTKTGEGIRRLGELALLDEITRRVGEEEKAAAEDDGPDELDSDRDAVVGGAGVILGGINHARGQHDTNGNAELVTGNQGTTNLAGALFERWLE